MHELEEGQHGFSSVDPQQSLDVARWRNATRKELLNHRAALSVDERKHVSARLSHHLVHLIAARYPDFSGLILSGYWPIKSEPDLREAFATLHHKGMRLALPVVAEKAAPLEFHAWKPGDPMERGFWNIPVPTQKIRVTPDILLAPLVGWDRQGYRLGYGGGYFDRTLSSLHTKRFVIGVGLSAGELATIFPQPHDIPLDAVLTEQGLEWSRV